MLLNMLHFSEMMAGDISPMVKIRTTGADPRSMTDGHMRFPAALAY
jgi:hypothetical protein